MKKPLELTVHIDGEARGNPGPAAYGIVFLHDGEPLLEENGYLGTATNNVAEYTALVKALEKAGELNASRLLIRSDSELLVKQMNGEYKVKNPTLKTLHEEASQLVDGFESVQFEHVRREQNKEADRLCNEALDAAARGRAPAAAAPPSSKPTGVVRKPSATSADSWSEARRAIGMVLAREAGDDAVAEHLTECIVAELKKRGLVLRSAVE